MSILCVNQLPTLRHRLTVTPLPSSCVPIPPPRLFSISLPLNTLSASAAALPTVSCSCEPSLDPAAAARKRRGRAASPLNPDSVLPFLSEIGLGEADIATVLSHDPKFLCASVEQTLKPRMSWLEDMGFSPPEICHLLVLVPRPFRLAGFHRKMEFLMGVFGSIKDLLVSQKKHSHITRNKEKQILQFGADNLN